MTEDEHEKMRAWVNNWKETGKVLKNLRREEFRLLNIGEEILALSDASESALSMFPAKSTSGLVEMQRLFIRFRNEKDF